MNRGLLLTLTEPPPAMEEEFNAWYDEEHLPKRLAIPGFRCARRWVCEQVEPGDAGPHASAAGVVYTMTTARLAGVLQMRRFAAVSGEAISLYEVSELRQPGALVYRLYKP